MDCSRQEFTLASRPLPLGLAAIDRSVRR